MTTLIIPESVLAADPNFNQHTEPRTSPVFLRGYLETDLRAYPAERGDLTLDEQAGWESQMRDTFSTLRDVSGWDARQTAREATKLVDGAFVEASSQTDAFEQKRQLTAMLFPEIDEVQASTAARLRNKLGSLSMRGAVAKLGNRLKRSNNEPGSRSDEGFHPNNSWKRTSVATKLAKLGTLPLMGVADFIAARRTPEEQRRYSRGQRAAMTLGVAAVAGVTWYLLDRYHTSFNYFHQPTHPAEAAPLPGSSHTATAHHSLGTSTPSAAPKPPVHSELSGTPDGSRHGNAPITAPAHKQPAKPIETAKTIEVKIKPHMSLWNYAKQRLHIRDNKHDGQVMTYVEHLKHLNHNMSDYQARHLRVGSHIIDKIATTAPAKH